VGSEMCIRDRRVRIPERPGALLDVLDCAFPQCNLLEFQYGKNDAEAAWFTIGVAVSDAQFDALAETLAAQKIEWRNVTGDADVQFRVIPYDEKLMRAPAFLRLDFYERSGALAEFLRKYLGADENICYFNYLYTGERVGRALIGIEFSDLAARERFLKNLPESGAAFRSCVVVDGPAAARLSGRENGGNG
ncbi:MAG TPA: pyridoxal-5'-phosphate-dependent protein, partial [Candidatus Spyradosoma merdigallinarum]|nr:pyridoxal-5'-phosphate-dependent protein [Candidatus Spyradosoma merdigallinarum]